MYNDNEYFKRMDNPTLAELMWERDLDPFNDDDCIKFGKSIAKFKYNIPADDFDDLLLEFVSEYLDERIGTGSLMQWMMHLRSYGMDRRGWYEDTYDLFKDIDKFAFLGRRVERDTNEDREKEEQGTVGTKRSEDEENDSTLTRDVNENGTTTNTRTQDDVLLGLRDRQEDVNKVNTTENNSKTDSEIIDNSAKTGDNSTTTNTINDTTNIEADKENSRVDREDGKLDVSKTGNESTDVQLQGEKTVTEGDTDVTTKGHDKGWDKKKEWGDSTENNTAVTGNKEKGDSVENNTAVTGNKEKGDSKENSTAVTGNKEKGDSQENSTAVTGNKEKDDTNVKIIYDIKETDDGDLTIDTDNEQKSLKQNATGIGTATGPLGGPISEGSFGSRAPSSGVVKDSTFEEGQTRDTGHSNEVRDYEQTKTGDETTITDGDKTNVGFTSDEKTTDGNKTNVGFTSDDKTTGYEDNEKNRHHKHNWSNAHTVVDDDVTKTGVDVANKKDEGNSANLGVSVGHDETDKSSAKLQAGSTIEDRKEDVKIDETTDSTKTEDRTESGSTETQENTAGNTLENINDNRKVDEEGNETRTNTTDIDEELFRKLRRMVEEDQERKDLSTESNRGTMVETTTGDVVPLMELARRYYDLRVSSKDRWVKDARKLFKYNYNF